MNPLEEYISIIHNRQQDPLPEGVYGERHHIIPRSCGGCNEEWNLIKLTPEEHYRCHYLLTFIYVEGEQHDKLLYAWHNMSCRRGEDVTVGEYARLKREWSKLNSNVHKGTHHTDETRKQISQHLTGITRSQETRRRISEGMKGKYVGRIPWNKDKKTGPQSEETKKRRSDRMKAYWASLSDEERHSRRKAVS